MTLKLIVSSMGELILNKVLSAQCLNQIIRVNNVMIDAEILSEGIKASDGIVLIDKENSYYIPSNASDIKDTIALLNTLLSQVVTVLTGLDAVSTSPGSQAANILSLTNLIAQFNLTKENLK